MNIIGITGLGVVCPYGIEVQTVYDELLRGYKKFSLETRIYGKGKIGISVCAKLEREIINRIGRYMSKSEMYLVYAVQSALSDAGLTSEVLKKLKVGLIIGNNDMNSVVLENYIEGKTSNGEKYTGYDLVKAIKEELDIKTVRDICVHNSCSSSNQCIELGKKYLELGICDVVICGAVDTISKKTYAAFTSIDAISRKGCLPFAKDRDGITISEGAGVIVMETEFGMKKRNRKGYCAIHACASTNDANSFVAPDVEGSYLAYKKVLSKASISINDIDYVMSHGTGTKLNDTTELNVLSRFDPTALQICSIKNLCGHMMSVSGIFAIIISCMIYINNIIPGNIDYEVIDFPEGITIIKESKRSKQVDYIACNSLGFGGNNSIVVLKKIR